MSELPYGRKACDLPGYDGCWVQFRTSGYPRKLRREWDEATSDETWAIVMRYVTAWELRDLDGAAVPLPEAVEARTQDILDNVEDAVMRWVIMEFARFWLRESGNPPKA